MEGIQHRLDCPAALGQVPMSYDMTWETRDGKFETKGKRCEHCGRTEVVRRRIPAGEQR